MPGALETRHRAFFSSGLNSVAAFFRVPQRIKFDVNADYVAFKLASLLLDRRSR